MQSGDDRPNDDDDDDDDVEEIKIERKMSIIHFPVF